MKYNKLSLKQRESLSREYMKNLGDLIEIKHGYAFKGEYFINIESRDILLTPGNFAIGGGFKDEKFKFYDGPVDEEYILKEGDLLVTMTDLSKMGDTLGYPALVPKSKNHRFLHNQRLGKITIQKPNLILKNFLYYFLCSNEYKTSILGSSTGSTVKHTSPERIKSIQLELPSLKTQNKIGSILSSLDKSLRIIKEKNEILEKIIQSIFKSWFIDFDGQSEFVDSDLGQIPKGWIVGKLDDVAINIKNVIRPTEITPDLSYIGLEHMPRGKIILSNWEPAQNLQSNKYKYSSNQILFGKLRPYFKKVGISFSSGICSTDILVLDEKLENQLGFILEIVSSDDFINYTNMASTGTKMPRTDWKIMKEYKIVIPESIILLKFENLFLTFITKIQKNIFEIKKLESIKNQIFPKLLSGEIHV